MGVHCVRDPVLFAGKPEAHKALYLCSHGLHNPLRVIDIKHLYQ